MSAFRVVGMTHTLAMDLATKLADHEREHRVLISPMKPADYEAFRQQKAEKIYSGTVAKPVSREFDLPQAAEDWLRVSLVQDGLRMWQLQYKHPCGKGSRGGLKYEWREWTGRIPELGQAELGLLA